MKAYAFDLSFSAPLTELPSASGLFGQLAWWVRYREGDRGVAAFLESFRAAPPWRISSAFPQGHLPRPLLPPANDSRLAESAFRKALKRVRYVDVSTFAAMVHEGEGALLARLETNVEGNRTSRAVNRTRVGIDRAHGGAYEGLLYTDTLEQPLGIWTVYVQAAAPEVLTWLHEGLTYLGLTGYGGKASVGAGRFSVAEPRSLELPEAEHPNAYTTLAPCIAPNSDGYYQLETYWGRLGGTFTHHENLFKRPYLRASAGSTFYGEPPQTALLETAKVGEATVYDYLYPFPLGVRLEEADDRAA